MAHVVNFDQIDGQPYDDWTNGHVTFLSPTPRHEDAKEAWHLTCEDKQGKVRATRDVVVDRGDRVSVGNVCSAGSLAAAKRARAR